MNAAVKVATFDLEVNGTRLSGRSWVSTTPARAGVVIAHGMAEHGGRYDRFGRALAGAGIAVFAVDHRGHGPLAAGAGRLGHVADRGGWQLMLDDLRGVVRHARHRCPTTPLVLFGHSMGSLLARELVTQPPLLVDGLVISAPPGDPGLVAEPGRVLAGAISRVRGADHRSKLLDRLSFGSFNAAFKPNRTDFDWLSNDQARVDDYVADPWCGQVCSSAFFGDLIRASQRVNAPAMADKTPDDLPILLIGGSADPVSKRGLVPQRVATLYQQAGLTQVAVNIYPGGRHELLNDVMADEVTADVVSFITGLTGDRVSAGR